MSIITFFCIIPCKIIAKSANFLPLIVFFYLNGDPLFILLFDVLPKLTSCPRYNLSGLGTTIVVEPMLTKYTINNGNEAKVGRRSLCRHFRSKTSSAKPKNIIQQMDNSAAMYSMY
jgi:hypothetical protein